MEQPAGYLQIALYENGEDEDLGVAKVQLPDINFPTVNVSGSGMMGSMEVPLIGMVDNMTTTIDFLSPTHSAVRLMSPKKHTLDLRVVEEYWDTVAAEENTWADKYSMLVRPKAIKGGTVAPMSNPDASGEYVVYYYAAYRNGKQLWEIDKRNMKCVIDGVDYMEKVRKALGK